METSPRLSAVDLVPDFGRYSAAVRRSWRVTVLPVALLAGVATYAVSSSSDGATAATFAVDRLELPDGQNKGLLGFVPPRRTLAAQADVLMSDGAWASIVAGHPGVKRAAIRVNEVAGLITIEAPGPPAKASEAVDAYVDTLIAARTAAATKAAEIPLAAGARLIAQIDEGLKTLDGRAGTGSETVDAGVAFERAELVRKRADVQEQLVQIQSFVDAAPNGVQRLSADRTTIGKIPRTVFAAIGGAVLALLALLVVAFADRRVRRRTDVERALGAGSFLGSIGRNEPTPEVVTAAAAVHHVAPAGGVVELVGVGDVDTTGLAAKLAAIPVAEGQARVGRIQGGPGQGADASTLLRVGSAEAVVLVVNDATVSEQELAGSAYAVAKAGGTVRGVLLVNCRSSAARLAG